MPTPDDTSPTPRPPKSRIQHADPTIGRRPNEPEPVKIEPVSGPTNATSKIQAFGQQKRHEEEWGRTPNTTGTGAIHVKTFHSKLTDDALRYMDRTINEWLDAHPQYEVKFVTSTVGILTSKLKEPHLVCQVWV